MNTPESIAALIRSQIVQSVAGIIFLFVAACSFLIALLRRRKDSRLLIWFASFIGLFGMRMLALVTDSLGIAGGSPWPSRIVMSVNYLLAIPGIFFWYELSAGALKRLCYALAILGCIVAAAGLGMWAVNGVLIAKVGGGWAGFAALPLNILRLNLLIAVFAMLVVGVIAAVPALSRKYWFIKSRMLLVAMPIIAIITVIVNVFAYFGVPPAPWIEPIVFGFWIFVLGYEAAQRTFANERRLLSIETELETARQIQASILPDSAPRVNGLRIAASYEPMSAVAGDFYQFLQPDDHSIGILVADVTGHGVPAALIASMIKIALQSVAACASEPSRVLSELNRILTPELRGQLTSAAYLFIDTQANCAQYAAAGHPPLIIDHPATRTLEHVESNGILFGVLSHCDYPARVLPLVSGDRFLLYSDGLIEPENASGEAFGNSRLGTVIAESRSVPAHELTSRLTDAVRLWQPKTTAQQDDITLVAIDLL